MALRLVVGLGNPGEEYSRTRHNVGFMVADRLAGESADWKSFESDLGLWTKVGSLLVAKPMTFMNASGDFVQRFAAYYKVPASEMLVVFDEIALPLGRIRIRPGGSAGGQNGMKSVIQRMGTDAIPRLRIGIGPQPPFMDSAAYVLQKFKPSEDVGPVLDVAVEAIKRLEDEPLDAVMNRYNPKA